MFLQWQIQWPSGETQSLQLLWTDFSWWKMRFLVYKCKLIISVGEPTWFYKPGFWQWPVFERNTLGQPDIVEILKGEMCEKEKRKNKEFKKHDEMMEANQKTCSLARNTGPFSHTLWKKIMGETSSFRAEERATERYLWGYSLWNWEFSLLLRGSSVQVTQALLCLGEWIENSARNLSAVSLA